MRKTIAQPSLDSIAERLNKVAHHGNYISACCPFHRPLERRPSMLVNERGFRCLSCNKSGSLRQLEAALSGIGGVRELRSRQFNWKKAPPVEQLAEDAHDLLLSFPGQGTYLKERGIESRIVPNQLGWYNGWYSIPVLDETQVVHGLVLRAGPGIQALTEERFLTPPGQRSNLYVPDWNLVRVGEQIYVVFGIFDALYLATLGFPVVTSTLGQQFDPTWVENFRKPIVVVPDAGEEQRGRQIVSALGWRGRLLLLKYPKGTKDPNDFHRIKKSNDLRKQLTAPLE